MASLCVLGGGQSVRPNFTSAHNILNTSCILPGGGKTVGQENGTFMKRVKAIPCKECGVFLNSEEQAKSHYGGKSHQTRLKELGIVTQAVAVHSAQNAGIQASKATFCSICKLTLNSAVQAEQHYVGKCHQNRLKELEVGKTNGGGALIQRNSNNFQTPVPGNTLALATQRQPPRTLNKPTLLQCPINQLSHNQPYQTNLTLQPNQRIPNGQLGAVQVIHTLAGSGPETGQHLVPAAAPVAAAAAAGALKRKASPIPCTVCCLSLNSEAQAETHFASGRHLKRMKMQDDNQKQWNSVLTGETPEMTPRKKRFFCQQCQLSVNSMTQLNAHMQGQQHRSKLQMGQHPYAISTIGQPGELCGMPSNVWTEVTGNRNGWFYCRVCNISVPTALALRQHIHSDHHMGRKGL